MPLKCTHNKTRDTAHGRKEEGGNGRKEDKLSSFRFLSRGLNVYFPRDWGEGGTVMYLEERLNSSTLKNVSGHGK